MESRPGSPGKQTMREIRGREKEEKGQEKKEEDPDSDKTGGGNLAAGAPPACLRHTRTPPLLQQIPTERAPGTRVHETRVHEFIV